MTTPALDVRATILGLLVDDPNPILNRAIAVNEYDAPMNILRKVGAKQALFVDVPASAIVVVNHDNPAHSDNRVLAKRTWFTIMEGIFAEGWGQAQLDYMESEIGEKLFDAPGASGILAFNSVGSAFACDNGLHRLTAAVCYLSGKQNAEKKDDTVVLRKVPVVVSRLHDEVQQLLTESSANGRDVFVADSLNDGSGPSGIRMRIVDPKLGEQRWTLNRDGGENIDMPRAKNWFERWRDAGQIQREPREPSWVAIPKVLLDALADHQWLSNQLTTPRYPDLPQKVTAGPDLNANAAPEKSPGTNTPSPRANDPAEPSM
jgi:hypothetical protein